MIVALVMFVGVQAVKVFVDWEWRSVEPFFQLASGDSQDDVVVIVGQPDFQFASDAQLENAADEWGLLCEEIERVREQHPLPEYQYPEPPNRFWDPDLGSFVRLPAIDLRVDVYRPSVRPVVLVYYNGEDRVARLIVCSP